MRCEACHKDVPDDAEFCPYCGRKRRSETLSGKREHESESERKSERKRKSEHESERNCECEYAAFISYRHLPRDQEVAKRVQKAIETYRMPQGVAPGANGGHPGKPGHPGHPGHLGHPGKLGKCFRDEDELAAAHSLPERILDALSKSSSLVVICTPDTGASVWIEREVEAFVEMHGRDRVFVVLADGSSAESIPDYLKTRSPFADGSGEAHSNPLAADMRPEASGKAREETLRLIAAIAGCGYDDLKQRDRVRRRKKTIIAAICAFAILAVVAGAFAFASDSRRSAQIAESQRLAAESADRLSKGDRYGAIEKALEALPSSDSSRDRPLVPEAQKALEEALQVYPVSIVERPWLPSYVIETEHDVGTPLSDSFTVMGRNRQEVGRGSICVNPHCDWFAIAQSDCTVETRDLKTGALLATCEMPLQPSSERAVMYLDCSRTRLVAIKLDGANSAVACFDAYSGKRLWAIEGQVFFEMTINDDGTLVALYSYDASGVIELYVLEIETGEVLTQQRWDASMIWGSSGAGDFAGVPDSSGAPDSSLAPGSSASPGALSCSSFGDTAADCILASGGSLACFTLDTGACRTAPLAYDGNTSLGGMDGVLVIASVDLAAFADGYGPVPYAIEAFDMRSESLDRLWRVDGQASPQLLGDGMLDTMLPGFPRICGLSDGNTAAVVQVDKRICGYDLRTGGVVWERSYTNAVVGSWSECNPSKDYCLLRIATCDGYATVLDLAHRDGPDPDGMSRILRIGEDIRWAGFSTETNPVKLVVVALSAEAPNRIIVYHSNLVEAEAPDHVYSLSELRIIAHDQLVAAGRA